MTSTPKCVVYLPWYQKSDYDRLKAFLTDGSRLAQTFEQWETSI